MAIYIVVTILAINSLYLLVFSLAGKFMVNKDVAHHPNGEETNFLVIFPAYKEDEVILQSVTTFMRQDYRNFTVWVIADQLKNETIELLRKRHASVCVLPDNEKRNKAKAINHLLCQLNSRVFNVCVVMDADNEVADNYLRELNGYFLSGAKVVQTQRIAKNAENNLSRLDGFSELINNHIFRKGQRNMGLSASLIGSGMAFETELFLEMMKDMDVYSGFDKELELRLLDKGIRIHYAENIFVLDEKVSHEKVFVNQRRRWMYAQLFFLRKNAFRAIKKLFVNGNLDYANKVFQFILVPRIILLGLSVLFLPFTFYFSSGLTVLSILNMAMLSAALLLPLSGQLKFEQLLYLLFSLPKAFLNMLYALLSSGKAAGKFLHTPHQNK